jgi:hypothetical protein
VVSFIAIDSLDAVKYSHARSGTPRLPRGLRLRFRAICFVYCEWPDASAGENRIRMLGIPTKPCAARVAAPLRTPESDTLSHFEQFPLSPRVVYPHFLQAGAILIFVSQDGC